jgi:hypothetical protein
VPLTQRFEVRFESGDQHLFECPAGIQVPGILWRSEAVDVLPATLETGADFHAREPAVQIAGSYLDEGFAIRPIDPARVGPFFSELQKLVFGEGARKNPAILDDFFFADLSALLTHVRLEKFLEFQRRAFGFEAREGEFLRFGGALGSCFVFACRGRRARANNWGRSGRFVRGLLRAGDGHIERTEGKKETESVQQNKRGISLGDLEAPVRMARN